MMKKNFIDKYCLHGGFFSSMNLPADFPRAPQGIQESPWFQTLVNFIAHQGRLIQQQAEEIVALKGTVQKLNDELARLKKLPKRPKFRPGGGPGRTGGNGSGSSGNSGPANKVSVQKLKQEIIIEPTSVPAGSIFKGYSTYAVQELEAIAKDVMYKLAVWETPDGTTVRGVLPVEISGSHFGPYLRALVHNLYASGLTQPGLFDLLRNFGIEISESQIHNLLVDEAGQYAEQSEEVLSAGLEEAPYIRTDDTGDKHGHKNAYCTHIGGEFFAYYSTAQTKSRCNFLRILLQGKEGYIINQAFIWHLFQSGVQDNWLNILEHYEGKQFRSQKGLNRLLNTLGVQGKKFRLQCLEAGLVGFISETILKSGQVLLSDRAGQFALFDHAACWVHLERPLRKLYAATAEAEQELKQVREAIWELYHKVKAAACTQIGKDEVHQLYDKLIAMQTSSPGIGEILASFAKYRDELLKALDHPGLPLHNNDSERDIRGIVKRRNISGGTKSAEGRAFRDGLMTLKQTCARLGQSFWEYLTAWFSRRPINLARAVRERYRAAMPLPAG